MNTMNNKVRLVGNPGADPEIRTLEGGRKMARINLATSEDITNRQGEKVKNTQWHNVVAFGRMAETAERLIAKGLDVMVEGKLSSRSYTDKQGVKRYITEVQASELLVFPSK